MGFTQAWLPPPNKAMAKVRMLINYCVKVADVFDVRMAAVMMLTI